MRRSRHWGEVVGVEKMERWRRRGNRHEKRGGEITSIYENLQYLSCSFIQTDASNYTGFRFKENIGPLTLAVYICLHLSVLYS